MSRIITAPGVLNNVQGQINHVTDMYDDIKDNNLKPLTVTLDPVTSANGSYSHATQDERITEDMKAISIEVGTPECFYAPIEVTTGAGTVTLTCADAHGNSTVSVTFIKTSPVTGGADYPPAVTSTEFDILADRIGSLTNLDTDVKTDLVAAVNNTCEQISEVEDGIAYRLSNTNTTGAALPVGTFVYIHNHSSLDDGMYTVSVEIGINGALTSSNLTAAAGGAANVLNSKLTQFTLIEGTTTSSQGGHVDIPFPTGFNVNNTMIVGAMIYSDNWWRPANYGTGNSDFSSYYLQVVMNNTGISVFAVGSKYTSKSFKIMLAKIT